MYHMLSDLKLLTKIVVPTYPTKVHILRLYSPKMLLVQSPNLCLKLLTKNVAPTLGTLNVLLTVVSLLLHISMMI